MLYHTNGFVHWLITLIIKCTSVNLSALPSVSVCLVLILSDFGGHHSVSWKFHMSISKLGEPMALPCIWTWSINFSNNLFIVIHSHDDVIKWKYLPRYWPFVRRTHRSLVDSLTKASDAELWCFLLSAPEQTVELTFETPVIWDAIALIMPSPYWGESSETVSNSIWTVYTKTKRTFSHHDTCPFSIYGWDLVQR